MSSFSVVLFVFLASLTIVMTQQFGRQQQFQRRTPEPTVEPDAYDELSGESNPTPTASPTRIPAPRAKPIFIPGVNIPVQSGSNVPQPQPLPQPQPQSQQNRKEHEYEEGEYDEYVSTQDGDTEKGATSTFGGLDKEIEPFGARSG